MIYLIKSIRVTAFGLDIIVKNITIKKNEYLKFSNQEININETH